MNRNIVAFFLILLLIPTLASAEIIINKYTNDFTATSPTNEQLKLCACETKVDKIIVENIGTFYGDFHVEVQGGYPNGIRIVKQDFTLAPKHFQEVLIYIENSCGLRNTYDYDVIVTNSYGREERIHRTIRVDMCETARLDVSPDNRTVGLCQPATFDATTTNIGTFADTFSLSFGQFEPRNAVQDMYLLPGESYTQAVTFQLPCEQYGKFNVPFYLYTEKNGPAASTWRAIDVTNQYNYAINLSSRIDVCAQTTTQVPIAVENIANVPDDVTFQLDAPGFVTLNPDVHLEPRERKNITLSIDAEDIGTHQIYITARNRFGGIVRERDVQLQINNCYDPIIDMRLTPEIAITEPVDTCCGEKTYYVNVRNNGDRVQTFILTLDGPSFFVLDETSVRLEPDQNANIAIHADLPCADEAYAARVIVSPQGQQQVNRSAQIVINSATERTCHMVQIDDDELEVPQTATIVPVIVKHTGLEGGEYRIDVNSTLFDIQEENITLMPGDQRAIHLVPRGNLSEVATGRYIVLPSFTFTKQELTYNEAVGVELEGKGLVERFLSWLSSLPWSSITFCVIVIFLLLLLIIAAAIMLIFIYSGATALEGVPPSRLFWWKALLIAGMVVLLVMLLFLRAPGAELTYERVADTTNSTLIEMYQNTEHTVDVSQYFDDPDRDILAYTVTQPRDISATLDGSMLTLRPDHNFAGENTIVITASDNKGGVADSPIFIIRVIPRKNISFLQCVQLWCHHIVVVELILFLILLLLIVFTIPEYRPKPYAGNTLVIVDSKAVKRRKVTRRTVRRTAARRASARAKANARSRKAKEARRIAVSRKATSRNTARKTSIARGKQVAVRKASTARGRQVVPAIREFKGSGQTVNIAVGTTPHAVAPPIVAVPGYKQGEIIYVGSLDGNTVHTPYCINARRIPKNKRVAFSTKREAVSAGLVPCKMCRPFEGGM
jgi:hypothetical protein